MAEINVTQAFPQDFDLKENPAYNDVLMIYDSDAGKVKQVQMEKVVDQAQSSYVGNFTPSQDAPPNPDNKPIWGDVSNDTGATQTYTNFKDSAGDSLQLVSGKSGKFSYDGTSWSFLPGDKTLLDATLEVDQTNIAALDASAGKYLNDRISLLLSPIINQIDGSNFGQGGWNSDGTRMSSGSSSYPIRLGTLNKNQISSNFLQFFIPEGFQVSIQCYNDLLSGWAYDSGWLENGAKTIDISQYSFYDLMIRKVDNTDLSMSDITGDFKWSQISAFNQEFTTLGDNTDNGLKTKRINLMSKTMEQGTIVSGNKAAATNRVRTFSLIQQDWELININFPAGYKAIIVSYDDDGAYNSIIGWNTAPFEVMGRRDFAILIAKSDDSDLTPSDLDTLVDSEGAPLVYLELKTAIKNAFKEQLKQSNILAFADFESGSWITGFKASSSARARSKGRISVKANYLRLVCPEDYNLNVQWSDEDSIFLSDTGWQKNGTIIKNIDKPFTIAVRLSSNGNFSPSAIDGGFYMELLDSPISTDSYTGNKIELNRQSFSMQMYLAAIQWGAMNSGSVQGLAIYGDKMFIFYDTGKVNLFQYSTKQFLGAFLLPQTTNNHCNSVCWGKEFPTGNSVYPALYDSEFYGDNRCLVYSLSDVSATLIQKISIGTMTNPLFMTTWHVDIDNDSLWALSCKTNTLSSGTDNNYWVTKFNLPSLASGNIVLTDADIVEQFDITNEAASQGFEVYNGIMMLLLGLSEQAKIKFIDLNAGNTEINNISLVDHGMEPEDCQVYKGELHIVFNYQNGTVCKLNF